MALRNSALPPIPEDTEQRGETASDGEKELITSEGTREQEQEQDRFQTESQYHSRQSATNWEQSAPSHAQQNQLADLGGGLWSVGSNTPEPQVPTFVRASRKNATSVDGVAKQSHERTQHDSCHPLRCTHWSYQQENNEQV